MQAASDWGPIATPVRTAIAPGSPPWKDNMWLGFWDENAGAYGLIHGTTSPNAGGRKLSLSVALDGRCADVNEPLPPGGGFEVPAGGGFKSDSLQFGIDGRFAVDAPGLSGELVVTPRLPMVDYTPGQVVPPFIPGQPIHHYQRSAFVRGTLTLNGIEHEIDGLGFRDRTWGFRNEADHLVEYWALLACLPSYDLTAMKFLDGHGEHRIDGFVVRPDGGQTAVTTIEVTRDSSALTASAEIGLADGSMLSATTASRAGGHWLPMVGGSVAGPSFSVYEEFGAFEIDGETGWGLVEHAVLRRLF